MQPDTQINTINLIFVFHISEPLSLHQKPKRDQHTEDSRMLTSGQSETFRI